MITRKPSRHFASGGTRPIPTSDLFCLGKCSGSLSQLELLDLAAGRARKLIHDLHTFRPELLRHLGVAQIGPYRPQIDRASAAGNDEGAAALAEPRIRKTDHGNRDHSRMLVEQVLDLGNWHVLSAPDQDVLHPARDADVAVVVHVGEIAGIKPSIAVEGRKLRPLVVALENLGAANQQSPRLPR